MRSNRQHLLDSGKVADTTEIAKREGLHRATVNELLRLALLAPKIIEAALEGQLPQTVTLEGLLKAALPRGWRDQQASTCLTSGG